MDLLEGLALRAAVLHGDDARQAWMDLTSRVDWMDLPDGVQRCLPAIAVNLACHGSSATDMGEGAVPYAARLGGVYRASWTENILRIRQMAPLLEDLASSGVDYRVLKGAAICAITDRWGVRRMGDIDVVVARADARKATTALRSLGFTPRFFRRISARRPPESACWEGPKGQILDLHVTSRRRTGHSILDWAMHTPAVTFESQGIRWPVPPPEVMLVHALKHAQLGAAPSDYAQALLDARVLLPRSDPRRLDALARRTGSLGLVRALALDLATLHSNAPQEFGQTSGPVAEWRRAWRRSWRGEVRRTLRLPAILFERLPRPRDVQRALEHQQIRRTLYVPWLVLGQLRPVERVAVTLLGGFVTRTGCAIQLDREVRLRVQVPVQMVGRSANVRVTCSDPRARVLFINGESAGVLAGQAGIFVHRIPETMEVSARFLGDPPRGGGQRHTLALAFPSSRADAVPSDAVPARRQ